jgi:hypothetical protein
MTRRRSGNSEMNLDSLLDTLTNVVGVLVLMLLLTSLNVREAVERILELNPEELGVSAADLAAAQQQAADLARQREALMPQVRTSRRTTDQQELMELFQKLHSLKSDEQPAATPSESPDQLKQQLVEKTQRSRELSQELVKLEEELQKLKGQLDQTEVVAAPPPKIVHLPNPRDPPPDAQPILAVCRDGRVALFDPDELREAAKKRVTFLQRPLQVRAGPSRPIDCQKLVEQFNESATVSSGPYRARLAVENFSLVLIYEPRGTAGETAKQVVNRASEFRRQLKRLNPQKSYVRFLVWSDSFDEYVAARIVCDELNLLAGWEPYDAAYQWKLGLGISVDCEGKPAPPPAPAPAPPAAGPPPPPPPPLPNDLVD